MFLTKQTQWSKIELQNYQTGKKFENIIETSFTVMIMNGMGRQIVHIKLCFPSISQHFFTELDEIQKIWLTYLLNKIPEFKDFSIFVN